jgi:hemerythrin
VRHGSARRPAGACAAISTAAATHTRRGRAIISGLGREFDVSFMEWTNALSVGLALMDADHIELMEQLNELHDAVAAADVVEDTGAALDMFTEYARMHFHREELLMARYGFPDAEAQGAAHLHLLQELLELRRRHDAGDPGAIGMNGVGALRDWLATHIRQDAPLAAFLLRQRASSVDRA